MRIKSEKKANIHQPAVRSLKIQPRTRNNQCSNTTAPEIKLHGSWLEQLGFHHGGRVLVTTMKGLLIIRVVEERGFNAAVK